MDRLRYVPDYRLEIGGEPISAALRASIISLVLKTGLEGADRLDITLANEGLRWLDNDQLKLDREMRLEVGYADGELNQVFVGEVVGLGATFPSGTMPTATLSAQDRRHRLQTGTKLRWFAIPVPSTGNFPLPDLATASVVALENLMIPVIDPVGAAISVLLGGVELAVVSIADPGGGQMLIRKQINESDYDFLARLAAENGWEMFVEHDDPLGGHKLRFQSPLDHLDADVKLAYGRSLLEFMPRMSIVGQIFSVSSYVWVSQTKRVFTVSLGWDWDRMALTLSVYPSMVPLGDGPTHHAICDPLTLATAPRRILAELIPKLNKRITAAGSTLGDPRIQAGKVVEIEGAGERFGGRYRITEATHRIDQSGYRTSFEGRKEIWFGSIPADDQSAMPVRIPFVG